MTPSRARLAIGCACAGWGVACSYTVQRWVSWSVGEAPASSIFATAHIPFYWRVDVALLQGLMLGMLAASLIPVSPRILEALRMTILITVPLFALALLWVP